MVYRGHQEWCKLHYAQNIMDCENSLVLSVLSSRDVFIQCPDDYVSSAISSLEKSAVFPVREQLLTLLCNYCSLDYCRKSEGWIYSPNCVR